MLNLILVDCSDLVHEDFKHKKAGTLTLSRLCILCERSLLAAQAVFTAGFNSLFVGRTGLHARKIV